MVLDPGRVSLLKPFINLRRGLVSRVGDLDEPAGIEFIDENGGGPRSPPKQRRGENKLRGALIDHLRHAQLP
jgi:hypothetical protein